MNIMEKWLIRACLNTNGAVGEEQKLIITKAGDSTFSELKIPLQLFQYEQDSASFVEDILKYSDLWFDFDVTIKEKSNKKE